MKARIMMNSVVAAMLLAFSMSGCGEGVEPLRGMRPYLVAVSVADLEESVTWYANVLGLRIAERKTFPDQGLRMAFLESEGFRLELVELKGSVSPGSCTDMSNPASMRGVGKVAFQVDDLKQAVAQLQKRGGVLFRDFRNPATPKRGSVIIKDPDGNWVQFFQHPS